MSAAGRGSDAQDNPRRARQPFSPQPGTRLRIALIRHAPTPGNLERRYIGASDEALSPTGRKLALDARASLCALRPRLLFTSGMRRCDETAAILFPDLSPIRVAGLAEMRFGTFEGKTYADLTGDVRYQAWVDAGCVAACPEGEDQAGFVARVRGAFEQALDACAAQAASAAGEAWRVDSTNVGIAATERLAAPRPGSPTLLHAAFVVHAGTIMAAMSELAEPPRTYWDWKATYCGGYTAQALRTENGWRLTHAEELGPIVE